MIPKPWLENWPTSHPKNTGRPALIICTLIRPVIRNEGQTDLDHGILHILDLRVHVCNRHINSYAHPDPIKLLTKNGASTPDVPEFIDGIQFRVLVAWVVDERERIRRLAPHISTIIASTSPSTY
jgi:hypothetical protein